MPFRVVDRAVRLLLAIEVDSVSPSLSAHTLQVEGLGVFRDGRLQVGEHRVRIVSRVSSVRPRTGFCDLPHSHGDGHDGEKSPKCLKERVILKIWTLAPNPPHSLIALTLNFMLGLFSKGGLNFSRFLKRELSTKTEIDDWFRTRARTQFYTRPQDIFQIFHWHV